MHTRGNTRWRSANETERDATLRGSGKSATEAEVDGLGVAGMSRGGCARECLDEEDERREKDRFCFVNNDNSSSNAYKQQRRVAYGLTVNTLPEINGIQEWDSRCNPFVPKSPVNTGTIIPRRDS